MNTPQPLGTFLAGTRLVTRTGPGGIGKTRLARHVAASLLERYPDGVWLAEFAPLTQGALTPNVIASELGAGGPSGAHPPALLLKNGQNESSETNGWAAWSRANASCTRSGGRSGTHNLVRKRRTSELRPPG